VVSFPHLFPVPPPLSDILEDRLSRSETAYRNKLGPGVSEAQLVDLMNSFAVKFRLPDYAKTTPAQIRFLRMGLALQSPAFMGSGLAVQGMRVGDSVSTEMSPLQAMHLFEIMIDQKIINPVFQDPLSDPLLLNEERRKKIDELRRASSTTTPGFGLLTGNTKISEMRSAISTGIESMSISDAYDLLDHTFNTMRLR
jgi:hypothetical protein